MQVKQTSYCVIISSALALSCSLAFASSCPQGDANLKNKTPLSQLCPNGFGQFQPGSIQDALQNNQTNTEMIVASAEDNGVPTDLALAVAYHESEGFNSCAGSPTGVHGPMQVTKGTANALGLNRDINEQNIEAGMQTLKSAYSACGYNYTCLASHYNGSPTPGEQAGWAKGVQTADEQLKNNSSLLAMACNGSCNSSTTPQINDLGPVTPSGSDSVQQIGGFA